jgi:long-subunit acyl-CoA synthetase (AMP-forming)
VAQAMVIGDGQDYLAVLLTLNTKKNEEKNGKNNNELTDNAQKWFRFAR